MRNLLYMIDSYKLGSLVSHYKVDDCVVCQLLVCYKSKQVLTYKRLRHNCIVIENILNKRFH